MNGRSTLYRAALALLVAASLVACGGGLAPNAPAGSRPAGQKHALRPFFLNLGDTQDTVTGTAIIPLTFTVSGTAGTLAAYGTTACAAASGANPCPNINFMASPPMWQSATPAALTIAASTLAAACTAPSNAPSPAPGFTPGCYAIAYEGGAGPYLIAGPVTGSAGSLSLPAQTATLNFNPSEAYNFFLAYVTAVASPPPSTPAPSPSPTYFATQPPIATPTPASTATPTAPPTATPTPLASFAPSPCPTATSGDGEHDDLQVLDGGDDGGTSCCSSSREDDGSLRTMDGRRHHGGDDGGWGCATPQPTVSPCEDGGTRHHRHRHGDSRSRRGHGRDRHHHRGSGDCDSR